MNRTRWSAIARCFSEAQGGHDSVVTLFMLEGDDGQRQWVRVTADQGIPDGQDPGWVFVPVQWWGGPGDGDYGVARISVADAELLLQICE